MKIKEEITQAINDELRQGSSRIMVTTEDYDIDLSFEIHKRTLYSDDSTNYAEFESIVTFQLCGSYIDIKGATLCDEDMCSIVQAAKSDNMELFFEGCNS